MKIETLQTMAPELIPNETFKVAPTSSSLIEDIQMEEIDLLPKVASFKMPKMPLVSSEVMKMANVEKKKKIPMQDQAVNTGTEHDVASEIAKHVGTLRKISLIAEEFNQKTGKSQLFCKSFLLSII